ncbi:MAG: phosphotransferase [Planctomycetota bacterium]|nr:phosphotransferase [Planctomycetota bacterium]
MSDVQPRSFAGATPDLAQSLEGVLRECCGGRLGHVDWFHSHHQRGGAATGFTTWRADSGESLEVVVKLPVTPVEHRWTVALGEIDPSRWGDRWAHGRPTPRVVAAGTALGGYDLAWLVLERLAGPALSNDRMCEQAALDLLRAAADFQAAAIHAAPLGPAPPSPDWERLLERSRALCRTGGVSDAQKWNDEVRRVQRALPVLRRRWESRPINAWCHGDLHPGNALRRPGPDGGCPCVLVDLALVHAGHWVEDALYLERQFWGHEKVLGIKPVPTLARLRRERGLPADDSYGDLALVRRVLAAACAPALSEREGNPRYLRAAMEIIGRCLPQAMK